jgi:hypothetical protein
METNPTTEYAATIDRRPSGAYLVKCNGVIDAAPDLADAVKLAGDIAEDNGYDRATFKWLSAVHGINVLTASRKQA